MIEQRQKIVKMTVIVVKLERLKQSSSTSPKKSPTDQTQLEKRLFVGDRIELIDDRFDELYTNYKGSSQCMFITTYSTTSRKDLK